ncbi:PorP/SprF family type IX secretion system membrane protein [Aquimarina aquimarini]|uniref:PorP/SprF family type IX secretion system membrane protein n=1 Tax=Aquimarina aquimarini TaxID=1191734 RepID=UPI000D54E835|nr:PorP/SprF family type IX secretion system membrane protein [Aquimarina aquimarini]
MVQYIYQIMTILILSLCNSSLVAQQTPLFTDYYYNQVLINPAHSGYHPDTEVSLSNFGYLNDFEGSPRTFSGILTTSVFDNNVGISGGVISDQIGVTSATSIFASYAYKLFFDHNYSRARWWNYNPNVLSFGLTTGVLFLNEELSQLNIQGDPNFENDVSVTVPSFGFGALYNHNKLYLGFSVQNLFSDGIASNQNINIQTPYYLYGGYRLYLSRFQEIRVQPSMLVKFEADAPAQFDFNVSVNYKNKIEVGAGYRSSSSLNALVGLYFLKNWRFAYSYTTFGRDTPITNTNGFVLTYKAGEGF